MSEMSGDELFGEGASLFGFVEVLAYHGEDPFDGEWGAGGVVVLFNGELLEGCVKPVADQMSVLGVDHCVALGVDEDGGGGASVGIAEDYLEGVVVKLLAVLLRQF